MAVRFELYGAGAASVDDLWTLVSDPHQLVRWTDAEQVLEAPPEPLAVGSTFAVLHRGRRWVWEVTTSEDRLVEAAATLAHGRLELGLRVLPDPQGARLVLAAALTPHSGLGALRARLVQMPALRRRCDRWILAALRAARVRDER